MLLFFRYRRNSRFSVLPGTLLPDRRLPPPLARKLSRRSVASEKRAKILRQTGSLNFTGCLYTVHIFREEESENVLSLGLSPRLFGQQAVPVCTGKTG